MAKKHKAGGFIEIEFLQPKNTEDIYLLEVNPRISGWIETFTINGISTPYIDLLLVPYIETFGFDLKNGRKTYDLSETIKIFEPALGGIDATDYYESKYKA